MSSSTVKTKSSGSTTKSRSSKGKNAKASPPPLKVVVRHLPHEMKEEEFLKAVVASAAEVGMGERGGSWDMMYFAPGKMSKKRGKVTGTAYLRIDRGRGQASAELSLVKLRAAIVASDVFIDEDAAGGGARPAGSAKEKSNDKGALGPIVETAPFQKLFKQKPKRDARVGTIEKDADYKAFCAELKKPTPFLVSADIQADIRESEAKNDDHKSKPPNALLDFLKERGAKRMKDSQRAAVVGHSGSAAGSRGSRRVSSRSAGGGGGRAMASATAAAAPTGVSKTTGTNSTAAKRHGSASASASASGVDVSRAPVTDAAKNLKVSRDAEKGGGVRGEGTGGGKNQAKEASSASRPSPFPPPPPTTGAKKSAANASAAAVEHKGRGSGTKTTSASSGGGGGSSRRTASRSGKSTTTSSSSTPFAILTKSKDNGSAVVVTASASGGVKTAFAASSTASPRGKGTSSSWKSDAVPPPPTRGGRGRSGSGGGGGGSGGKGRAGGKSSGSSRSKGGGSSGGGGGS